MQELQEISGVRAGTAVQSTERRPHRDNRVNPPGVGLRGLCRGRLYNKLLQPDNSTLTNTIHPLATTITGVG